MVLERYHVFYLGVSSSAKGTYALNTFNMDPCKVDTSGGKTIVVMTMMLK